jgi:hypothetical protein
MRVTIESPDDTIVLEDTHFWSSRPGWWLQEDPLDGWWGTPDVRVETADIPQQDGQYWPAIVNVAHRVLTIRGMRTLSSSTMDIHEARARVNALVAKALTVTVEDGGGALTTKGYISAGTGAVMHHSEGLLTFSLVLTCPDPAKYGQPVRFPVSGGVAMVENQGTADVWCRFIATGSISTLTATLGDATVKWHGPAGEGLTLDTYDALPMRDGELVGTLIEDDLFKIPPGVSDVAVSATAGASVVVEVRSGWR